MLMADAEERSSGIMDELFSAEDECDDVFMDLDSFWRVMGAPASPSQGNILQDSSSIDVPQASDSRTGSSDGLSESTGISCVTVGDGMLQPSPHFGILDKSCSKTVDSLSHICMAGAPLTPSSYCQNNGGTNHVTHDGESSRLDFHFEYAEDALVIDGDGTSQEASHTESSSCEINPADFFPEHGMYFFGSDDPLYFYFGSRFQQLACDGGRMVNTMDEVDTFGEDFISDIKLEKIVELNNEIVSKASEVVDYMSYLHPPGMIREMNCQKPDYEVSKFKSYLSKFYQGVQHNKLEHNILDNASDLCILEGMSSPAVTSNPETWNGKLVAASQISTLSDPVARMVMGHSRLRPDDERAIFQVAVQDLSQPKSEATPPDGVLVVPLMKHQRIALSWMVNKETEGTCCCGGILADDQGLGKTVSTIALILKERPPSSKPPIADTEQSQIEMCDLHDENGASDEVNGGKTNLQIKGGPSAGTLIVCPTSVLRQWSEEFHNKVTSEANLSVLVYHGSSRTKNPLDISKYDVVITTYAIVSMEVPKQPAVDNNDDQMDAPLFSFNKKRKLLEDETASSKKSTRRNKKSSKRIDNELFETISGPLAKVGWFRVVLDEAQTIKNHRTQVARACWGLRAKRRWCLSGTPIQNTIDDLYSYFRFLRHDPYANFKNFCEKIKSPIHRNPKDGFRKLQAVLKTIMLRRTKGTYIDGEPIVNIPPKTIELKTVDFSNEEREFYCRLEADSQAQFSEYAKAGTVKQNYVNILLMLLRLRQACDHPLLVRGFSSTSQMASSIEMAKKLSPEKTISLLNCLEASLAICGVCNDSPEDAVVTFCGHIFCNQCIFEHMISEEKQCPNKNCEAHLTPSNIYSSTTLRAAMSESPNLQNHHTSNSSVSELESSNPSLSYPEGSSKIKAALELLLSISRPHDSASILSSLESNEGCYGCDCNPGEKAIVFSQWTKMLDFLEDRLKDSSIQYRRLDGTMPIAVRDKAVKDFTTLSQVTVMIMSLKAASLGLNMVAACHVILLDLWWNPTTEDQAIDRAHRIGQTRPVSVYRLTVRDTVEDRILALQERKREMVASAFGEDETGSRQTRLTVDDLKYLFRVD